ncbi:hypothetical protein ZIOFF_054686 [Zingiber officinale]|uniref:Uncharacterized protein n=1 Tax=Zingiber officinale TaxID=94328 RepID=A0A8J5FUX6_ZINOF|nr:hypothetical protein ZIOFF_054686 [Zingiber officinale]
MGKILPKGIGEVQMLMGQKQILCITSKGHHITGLFYLGATYRSSTIIPREDRDAAVHGEELVVVHRRFGVATLFVGSFPICEIAPRTPPHAAGMAPRVYEVEVVVLVDKANGVGLFDDVGVEGVLLV